jgi:hypothetical protein
MLQEGQVIKVDEPDVKEGENAIELVYRESQRQVQFRCSSGKITPRT